MTEVPHGYQQWMAPTWHTPQDNPQFFGPLRAWTWKGTTWEADQDGRAVHRAACDLNYGHDVCSCGAAQVNEMIRQGRTSTWQPSPAALAEADRLLHDLDERPAQAQARAPETE